MEGNMEEKKELNDEEIIQKIKEQRASQGREVQTSTMKNRNVEQCIAAAVRRWLFPKPKGGGIVIVSYPFVLKSSGG